VERPVAFLDVFAERPLAGNGLAVVAEADGLGEEVMLAFARETRLSETTFVQSAGAEGADYRNRILTPAGELPFAGHPSLGTAVAVAGWRGEGEAAYVQQTEAGLQSVQVHSQGSRWRAAMLQGEPELGPELDRTGALASAGLGPEDADPELPPRIATTGLVTAIVPVRDRATLARVRPDFEAIGAFLRPLGAFILYAVWCEPAAGRAAARGFAAEADVGEDPATGSSAGALCGYLAEHARAERVTIAQGEDMGRPSLIEAEMEGSNARVGGTVIPLIGGSVRLPTHG
jgi:trans-2,3-dihydro-3-hydroxyanthranilate isomerase